MKQLEDILIVLLIIGNIGIALFFIVKIIETNKKTQEVLANEQESDRILMDFMVRVSRYVIAQREVYEEIMRDTAERAEAEAEAEEKTIEPNE